MIRRNYPPQDGRYTYFIGQPSWHQQRAGHGCAGVLIADHTQEEHDRFVARYQARHESITWRFNPTQPNEIKQPQ